MMQANGLMTMRQTELCEAISELKILGSGGRFRCISDGGAAQANPRTAAAGPG